MKKAEQRALKQYPIEDGKIWTSAFGTFEFDRNYGERQAFQKGYEQAEKDLALTWEDIPRIIELTGKTFRWFSDQGRAGVPLEELYEEVLRRFNKWKEEK